jgi:hypothetical protein
MTHGDRNIPRRYGDLGALTRDEPRPGSVRPRSNALLETGTFGESTSTGQRSTLYFCERQQDAIQMEWDGVVAAIDGSADRKTETMGAGFVVGVGSQPDSLFFPFGGPSASFRAESAGLDGLFDRVEPDRPLLVFTDCLYPADATASMGSKRLLVRPGGRQTLRRHWRVPPEA